MELMPQFLLSIGDQGRFNINLEDEVVRRSIVTHNKEILWPAPTAPAPATTVPGVATPVSLHMPYWFTRDFSDER
jgi:NAD(P) transhydrogenase